LCGALLLAGVAPFSTMQTRSLPGDYSLFFRPLDSWFASRPWLCSALMGRSSDAAIHAVVRSIPRGRVATYGQVAELAGIPSGHRVVARYMRTCPAGLPWQRVVGKKDARRAQINLQDPKDVQRQRALLRAEGVTFDVNGYIVLKAYGWLPT
jgi:methylated-DNA-protein-cysteine methyltransferase-like protein